MKKAVSLILLAAVCFVLYKNVLHGPFLFDDNHSIVHNPYITSFRFLPEYFVPTAETVSKAEHSGWRPLWYASVALNYHLGGLDTFGFHIFNLMVHILNSALIFLISLFFFRKRTENPYFASLFAALVFSAHPLQTETVSYIVSRSGLMVTFFYLAAFYLYVNYRETKKPLLLVVGVVVFCLALMSKEISVSFPLMVVLYDYLLSKEKPQIKHYLIFGGIFAAYTAFWLYGASLWKQPTVGHGFIEYWMTEVYVVVLYILKTLLPVNLNIDPDVRAVAGVIDPRFYLSLALLLALFIGLWRLFRKDRLAGFFGLWFFVTILPESIFPINDFMAEHRTYLPLAGVAVLAGYGMDGLMRKKAAFALGLAMALLLSLSGATVERNKVYASERTLWEDTAKKSPNKARPVMSLGHTKLDDGDYTGALDCFTMALLLDPGNPLAHYSLSRVYEDLGQMDNAFMHGLRAAELMPDDYNILLQVAKLYSRVKDDENAIQYFKKASSSAPDIGEVRYQAGIFYLDRGMLKEAVEELKAAVDLAPHDADAHMKLGTAYAISGMSEPARMEFEETLSLSPNNAYAHYNLAGVLIEMGDMRGALEQFEIFLRATPPDIPERARVEAEVERLNAGRL